MGLSSSRCSLSLSLSSSGLSLGDLGACAPPGYGPVLVTAAAPSDRRRRYVQTTSLRYSVALLTSCSPRTSPSLELPPPPAVAAADPLLCSPLPSSPPLAPSHHPPAPSAKRSPEEIPTGRIHKHKRRGIGLQVGSRRAAAHARARAAHRRRLRPFLSLHGQDGPVAEGPRPPPHHAAHRARAGTVPAATPQRIQGPTYSLVCDGCFGGAVPDGACCWTAGMFWFLRVQSKLWSYA